MSFPQNSLLIAFLFMIGLAIDVMALSPLNALANDAKPKNAAPKKHLISPRALKSSEKSIGDIILATSDGYGVDILRLDGHNLELKAAFESGFWGPVASLLSLSNGNLVVIEKTSRGSQKDYWPKEGLGSGKASASLIDTKHFDGLNCKSIANTTYFATQGSDAIDGSLGGIVNNRGEIFLHQNSNTNFDGGTVLDGLKALATLPSESSYIQTGTLNIPTPGNVGVALSSGDWVLCGYEPLGPDRGMTTLEYRRRSKIGERNGLPYQAGLREDPPTALGANCHDKILLGTTAGVVRQFSVQGSDFTIDKETLTIKDQGQAIVAATALSNGNWVVLTLAKDAQTSSLLILKEGTLKEIYSESTIPPATSLAIRPGDDIIVGTANGEIRIYDSSLRVMKQVARGFARIEKIAVLSPIVHGDATKENIDLVKGTATQTNAILKSKGLNALKPRGKPGPELTLATEQQAKYGILCSAVPSVQEVKAANELQHWLHEMTGANFPLIREALPVDANDKRTSSSYKFLRFGGNVSADGVVPHFISIGSTKLLEQSGPTRNQPDLAKDGYSIAEKDGNLYLQGGTRRGPINAVLALLEEDLGCRWYTSTRAGVGDVTNIPWYPTLRFRPVLRSYIPVLSERRDPYYSEAVDGEWSLRNRTLGIAIEIPQSWGGGLKPLDLTGFVHSFNAILPREEFFATHPEYFMMEADGRRSSRQLDLTNPDVSKLSIERIRSALKKDPTANIVDVSPNDGGGICQCPLCQEINSREKSGMGTLLSFVNSIADAIRDERPDVKVTTLAYLDTIMPPEHLRPRDNVLIWLAADSHAWEHLLQFAWEVEPNEKQVPGHIDVFDKALQSWRKTGAQFVIWDYPIDYHNYIIPLPNMIVINENIRYYVDSGAVGVFLQAQHNLTFGVDRSLMRSWVWAKLLWDPTLDAKALIEDFNAGFYGKAVGPMQQYDELLAATWEDLHSDLPRLRQWEKKYGPGVGGAFLTNDFINKALALFVNAQVLAGDDQQLRARIDLAELPVLFLQIEQGTGDDIQTYLKRIDRFEVIARQNHVTNIRSGIRGPVLDEQLKIWRDLARQAEQ